MPLRQRVTAIVAVVIVAATSLALTGGQHDERLTGATITFVETPAPPAGVPAPVPVAMIEVLPGIAVPAPEAEAVRAFLEAHYQARLIVEFLEHAAWEVGLWENLHRCEGVAWSQTGPRYQGGLGLYSGTWIAYGGLEYADNAGRANPWQQVQVAERVARRHGPASRPWDSCTIHVPYGWI